MLASIDSNYAAMFDFFFKRRSTARAQAASLPIIDKKAESEATKFTAKQADLIKAASFAGQESSARAFILQSEFADARYQAAAFLHSQEALSEIAQAMRNTDRRVTRLAQEKLAELQRQRELTDATQACILQGQALLANPQLMANQVTQWDKQRLSLCETDTQALSLKEALEQRLQAQVNLQRGVLQLMSLLDELASNQLALDAVQSQWLACENQYSLVQADTEVSGLPKNQFELLVQQYQKVAEQVRNRIEAENALLARGARLLEWQTQADLLADRLRQDWKAFSIARHFLSEQIQALFEQQEQEFSALLARFSPTPPVKINKVSEVVRKPVAVADSDIEPTLAALEQALEQGSLQQALDLEKNIRTMHVPVRGELAARLTLLRGELHRLLDWAKWGGNVSREELIKVADGLPDAQLAPQELAKQVGGLRARWKELDRTSGPAAKDAWERFDRGCSRAYEIAAAHFKQQTQLRQDNFQQAQALLAEVDAAIVHYQVLPVDFKALIASIARFKQDWRKIGPIDRKKKIRLESEFAQKIAELNQPLQVARDAALAVRQQLIAQLTEIPATDRSAAEKVQQAQQRWQSEAVKLPLERREEQQLWQQFRIACDAVFAQRRASGEQQKQRRHELAMAKEQCCERLEQDDSQAQEAIEVALRRARQEWHELSGAERQTELEARFQAAATVLENRLAALVLSQKQSELITLRIKIKTCQQLEAALSDVPERRADQCAAWQAEWQTQVNLQTGLHAEISAVLERRFSSVVNILQQEFPDCAPASADDLALFREHLLRMEILSGLESPAELARQRLQFQVQDLQSVLKGRPSNATVQTGTADSPLSNLLALCALSVTLDTETEQRFQRALENYILS